MLVFFVIKLFSCSFIQSRLLNNIPDQTSHSDPEVKKYSFRLSNIFRATYSKKNHLDERPDGVQELLVPLVKVKDCPLAALVGEVGDDVDRLRLGRRAATVLRRA